jgi:hypothetical protein
MLWPIYAYLIVSVAVAVSAAAKAGWAPGLYAVVVSFLCLVAGGGLKASLWWGDKAQKIGGAVVAALVVALAQWLAGGFSVLLIGHHLDGSLWGWIGFGIGLVFTNRKLAASRTAPSRPMDSSAELLGKLGELMERYPTALLDTSRLPAPKQKMKAVIKEVWLREPALRGQLTHAYMHLSQFQDGIGDAVLDCVLPRDTVTTATAKDLDALRQQAIEMTGPKGENFRQWIMWSKVSISEMEILLQEWRTFEREAVHDMRGIVYILAIAGVWILANLLAQRLYPTYQSDEYHKRIAYRVIYLAMFFVVCGVLAGVWWLFTGQF